MGGPINRMPMEANMKTEKESCKPQLHSFPVGGDEPLHFVSSDCWCHPSHDAETDALWIHNAKDCREAKERAGAVDMLSFDSLWVLALAENSKEESRVLCEAVESWESNFERFGLEPDTAIKRVEELERECIGLRENILSLIDSIEPLISWHADKDADPLNSSPEDSHAHCNGLALKECQKARQALHSHTNMKTETPISDALWERFVTPGHDTSAGDLADLARKLEAELKKATQELVLKMLHDSRERDAWRKKAEYFSALIERSYAERDLEILLEADGQCHIGDISANIN